MVGWELKESRRQAFWGWKRRGVIGELGRKPAACRALKAAGGKTSRKKRGGQLQRGQGGVRLEMN